MKGIEAAFVGAVSFDAQLRTAKSGREWLSVNMTVGEDDDAQPVNVAAFSGDIADLAIQLVKGTQAYVEGKIKLRRWQDQAGNPCAGLSVSAAVIQPLGLIGERRPKKPKAERKKPAENINAPLPFNDSLPF